MSRRTIFWIVATAVLLHGALFFYFGRFRALPRAHVRPPAAKPNFHYEEATLTDPRTGEKSVYRDFQISTKLADPATLPPPPAPTPAP